MKNPTAAALLVTAGILLFAPPAPAEGIPQDARSALETAGKVEICAAVKESIADDVGTRAVVRTAIELGHPACTVVRCALDGGGELKEVIAGAREAGTAPEVVSRCSIEAGADAAAVAAVLALPEIGVRLCYFEPTGAETTALPAGPGELPSLDPIPPEQSRSFISPFTFP